jgi:hypothetical protein
MLQHAEIDLARVLGAEAELPSITDVGLPWWRYRRFVTFCANAGAWQA